LKAAYRYLAKTCHPDVHADGHDLCILLNEAYDCLFDPQARAAYDARLQAAIDLEADDYSGEPLSKWLVGHKLGKAPPMETRAVFVDEFACIGCKNCIFEAAATFRMESEHGRSRVFAQWVDPETKIQRAIDSCPVECIHWVDKADLPALEHVTQKVLTERTNVGLMMAGAGRRVEDPFEAASRFVRAREAAAKARVTAAAAAADASPARRAAREAAAEAIRREQFGAFAELAGAFAEAAASVGATQASQPAPPSEAPPIQLPPVAACTQEAAAWAAVAAPAPAAGSAAGGRLQALQSRQSTPTAAPAIHRRGAASRARVAGGGTARPSRRGASARHRGRG
jgi:ferredoxin